MDERSIVSFCSEYTEGSSFSYIPESLTSIALCRPFEIRWSLPEKRDIDRNLLGCLLYKVVEDPVTHEVFTVLRHVQGHHDGRLNFLQPGFLIASLDDRPLHRVTETRSAVGAPGTGTSQITQECAVAASGGFDADLYAGKEKNTVDIIYMKPVARLMNNAECSISGHRIQPSIMSSRSFGDTEHSSSIVDRDPLVDLWNATSCEVMHHIPFCYLTILSASPFDQNPSQILVDDLFLRRELPRLSSPGKSNRLPYGAQLNSGNKFFLNVTMDIHGQINWRTLNETPDLYLRCKATAYARLLRRNTSPMPVEEILLRTPAPAHVLSPLLEGNVDRSVDVFVSGASNKSHKFLQLFIALYSVMLITLDVDDLNEAQISRIYEYMAKLQYFVSNSSSVPVYFVGLTKKPFGVACGTGENVSYPILVEGYAKGGSAFDQEVLPQMSHVVVKLNKVLSNLGGTHNVKLCIVSDASEASRRNAINLLRTSVLEDVIVQKSWGFGGRESKNRPQAASDKYLVKFLSCRQTIISKALDQWSRNESACMEIEQFIKFILDHSKLTTRELTTAISYFENSGFIRTITATTNTSKGWVLLYPQYVFVVICNLMKRFAPMQFPNMGFRLIGLLDSRHWALYFEEPLAFVLHPYSIMTYLGLFYFEVPQREQRQTLMASQFDANSHRRLCVAENNNSKVELTDKTKKKCKFASGKSPHLCDTATAPDSELFFTISLSGTVSRRTAWELHHLLFSLIVDSSHLFSPSRNSFFAAFPTEVTEKFVPYPEEFMPNLTHQQNWLQVEFQFLGIKSLRNVILVRVSAISSNFTDDFNSDAASIRNYERIFGSFLRERALRVLGQLKGDGPEGPGNVAACLDSSCGIHVEPLCACEKNEIEA